MKKITILLAILVFFTPLFCPLEAEATTLWVRVVDDDVCLYATDYNSKVICLLEKSYYLSVLQESDKMFFVSVMDNKNGFPQITGYVWKESVEVCEESPVTPYYPTEKVTVCSDSAYLKLSPVPSAETVIVATNTQELAYYGKIVSYNKNWYYVCFGDKFGYVDADSVTKPQIVMHPTPIKKDVPVVVNPTEPDQSDKTDEQQTISPGMEITLIVFVVLLAAGLTLAIFLPGNVKKNNVFDQDI